MLDNHSLHNTAILSDPPKIPFCPFPHYSNLTCVTALIMQNNRFHLYPYVHFQQVFQGIEGISEYCLKSISHAFRVQEAMDAAGNLPQIFSHYNQHQAFWRSDLLDCLVPCPISRPWIPTTHTISIVIFLSPSKPPKWNQPLYCHCISNIMRSIPVFT